MGMASVFLIILFINDELSFDKFHANAGDIYRIAWQSDDPQTRTPHPMPLAMVEEFPEVIAGTSLSPLWAPGLTRATFAVRNPVNNVHFDEEGILSVDSTFLKVFSFKLLKGNADKVLKEPGYLVITEKSAKKYFGEEDPVGKFLQVTDDERAHTLEVGGVIEDVPVNSHFHFDGLISYVSLKRPGDLYYTWDDFGHYNYIKLRPGADAKALEAKLMDWAAQHIDIPEERLEYLRTNNLRFILQPLTDIHLKSQIRWELEPNGNISYIYIMASAAIIILLIAGVNFMNLTTSKSTERAKEIGVRKSLGSTRNQLAIQFISESLLLAGVSAIISGLLVELILPWFNSISGKALEINYFKDYNMLLWMVGIAILVGILSGLYPALIISSSKPHLILKGGAIRSGKGKWIRQTLVIFQFGAAMLLITGTAVIYQQLNFIQNTNLGFDKEELVFIPIRRDEMRRELRTLKTELLRIEGVTSVSAVSNVPGKSFNQNPVYLTENPQNRINASEFSTDFDIFPALNIKLSEGRLFDEKFSTDSTSSFIINRAAATSLSPNESVVGKELTWDADGNFFKGSVVGIVENFRFQSLHQPVRPVIFQIRPSSYNHLLIKMKTVNPEKQLKEIEAAWSQFENSFAFSFSFLDETINNQYRSEQRMGKVFNGFSVLAVIISSMGLFALASLLFTQRQKEIGIRKVLGAHSSNLIIMLLKNFTVLVFAGIIIGIPISYFLMNNWLANFNVKIELSPSLFILAALLILLISWATIGYLTYKTAKTNPVETLRME
jgi:putative ABC transport system permease protein